MCHLFLRGWCRCFFRLVARQLEDEPPLGRSHRGNAEPGLFESLEVLERFLSLCIGLEVLQSDLLRELAAEFNVHHNPFRVLASCLGVMVRVFRIKGRLCSNKTSVHLSSHVKIWEGLRTVNRMLLDNLHHADHSGGLAIGVIEEGLISFLHVAHQITCCVVVSCIFQAIESH